MALGRTAWLGIISLAMVLVAGCVVSPMPLPPNFDVDKVSGKGCAVCDVIPGEDPEVFLWAGPGSISDPEALLWVVNLDGLYPAQSFPVEPDGSFEVTATGFAWDEFRIQARRGDQRSSPVDVLIDGEEIDTWLVGPLRRSERALADCFTLEPPTEIDFSARTTAMVELSNQCSHQVDLASPSLRAPAPAFQIGNSPSSLPVGGSSTVSVEFTTGSGLGEEILFIEVTAPMRDRRPITLIGRQGAD